MNRASRTTTSWLGTALIALLGLSLTACDTKYFEIDQAAKNARLKQSALDTVDVGIGVFPGQSIPVVGWPRVSVGIPGTPGAGGTNTNIPGSGAGNGTGTNIPGSSSGGGTGVGIPGSGGGAGGTGTGIPGSGGSRDPDVPGAGGAGTGVPGSGPGGGTGTGVPGGNGGGGAGTGVPGSGGGGGAGTGVPGGNTPPGDAGTGVPGGNPLTSLIPTGSICSNKRTDRNDGVNLRTSASVAIVFKVKDSATVACKIADPSILAMLTQSEQIDLGGAFAKCLEAGQVKVATTYSLDIIGQDAASKEASLIPVDSKFYVGFNGSLLHLGLVGNGYGRKSSTMIMLIADTNEGDEVNCDRRASPLVIQIENGLEPEPIRLTAPSRGVFFDILGENAKPVAHAKTKISWLARNAQNQHYFLVKPNAKGEVNGIDELFGDNTKGPDGKFAANGYEALRKFDGRTSSGGIDAGALDGFISKHDAVFGELRLWRDDNRDGRASLSELFSLSELGLEVIDLGYDSSYLERDRWGNETRMKSVAKTGDGKLHLVFDLWFRLP